MAAALKLQFGADVPRRIAAAIAKVHPAFPSQAFLGSVLHGYAALDLMARGRAIADALRAHLPAAYPQALSILMASLAHVTPPAKPSTMAPFFYLPHTLFIARHGLQHFAASMRAQYVLTQRFTAEFSIRPFLERHPARTLALLAKWARDDNEHVRRLVSRGDAPATAVGIAAARIPAGSRADAAIARSVEG